MSNPPADSLGEAAAARQLSLDDLEGEHRQLLVRAIARILSTELAKMTYAQVIDGLPTGDVAYDAIVAPHNGHPIDHAHDQLCPGMLEKAREFRDGFQPEILFFDSQLLHGYRACALGSPGFKTRLVELVAVAVHQIAAILFELDTSVHKDDGITDWAPPRSDVWYWRWYPNGPHPTLFYHWWYLDYAQYPRSVADVVGYWAEARILGGVVLFDRRDPKTTPEADSNAIYFHPDRYEVTYRIYQLLPEQRKILLDFLLADEPPACPLPILPDLNNRIRVDPEEPIKTTKIYRDLWERKSLPPDAGDQRERDVWDEREWPTMEDWRASRRRARERGERVIRGEYD